MWVEREQSRELQRKTMKESNRENYRGGKEEIEREKGSEKYTLTS